GPNHGYQWQLPADRSTHVCIAVEIYTPDDPIKIPDLLGLVPGPADSVVMADNNKAQLNILFASLPPGAPPPPFPLPHGFRPLPPAFYAIVHNATKLVRDMTLQ